MNYDLLATKLEVVCRLKTQDIVDRKVDLPRCHPAENGLDRNAVRHAAHLRQAFRPCSKRFLLGALVLEQQADFLPPGRIRLPQFHLITVGDRVPSILLRFDVEPIATVHDDWGDAASDRFLEPVKVPQTCGRQERFAIVILGGVGADLRIEELVGFQYDAPEATRVRAVWLFPQEGKPRMR